MSGFWGAAKSYTGYIKEIATGGSAVGATAGASGALTTTTTTITFTAGAAPTAVTTVTTGAGTILPAAAACAGAAAVGTLVGQGVDWVISWVWDPVAPLYSLDSRAQFTSVSAPEIDSYIRDVLSIFPYPAWALARSLDAFVPPVGWPPSLQQMRAGASPSPDLCAAAVRFLQVGVRTFADAVQGAAAATVGEKQELNRAADALRSDIQEYIAVIKRFADCINAEPLVGRMFPTYALPQYLSFIEESRSKGQSALPEVEGIALQKLFALARVRNPSPDFRDDICKWLAEGPDERELASFRAVPNETLTFAQILRGSIDWRWSRIDLSQSPLIKGTVKRRRTRKQS